ncbi:MAG TPA: 6-pyruvoyl tetrahydropterin synthase family protein [Gemmatimonadales bacterium]|nr:6-pyruvoyl tetrahydropterin synthase family protein [Gemmatimonadales bacterium]
MQGEFKVSVSKDYLVFASAHFITFRGHQCESLHGHNYRVGVTVEGAVDPECAFVVDFAILKHVVKRLIDPIDHKVLLPTENPKLRYEERDGKLHVHYFDQLQYVFPRGDCALLPISNTTAEMIAQYLARRVRAELEQAGADRVTGVEVEVEESFGQAATYREAAAVLR